MVSTTPVSAHQGNYRVVMIPGWHGDGSIFKTMIPILQSKGISVVDFQPEAGVQAINHDASIGTSNAGGLTIAQLADQVEGYILAKTSTSEKLDFVCHSMGGLIARYLIEKGPSDPNIRDDWAQRIDDLIMLGTPNHGTWEAYIGQLSPLFGKWANTAADMKPGSSFLNSLGYSEPNGEDYTCVGGEPWYLPIYGDYNGDGISRGFDGVVPADSPWLVGSENYIIDAHHGELATKANAIDIILETLGYTAAGQGSSIPLMGDVFVRLEYFKMSGDHEWGTEEYFMDVYVDADGGANSYQLLSTLTYDRDGPFIQNWGNSGPTTSALRLPETSATIDVKVVLREDNDVINVFYYRDLMLSEDVDGVDYYSDTAADPDGGTNEIRLSVNGITSDISQTCDVQVVFTQARIDYDGDWGNGENYFKTWTGRLGYENHYNQWYTWSGEDTYYIYGTYGSGSSDALLFSGRMLDKATLHLRIESWDDDGVGDDHLSADLDVSWLAESAAGSYYWDKGDVAYWVIIYVT